MWLRAALSWGRLIGVTGEAATERLCSEIFGFGLDAEAARRIADEAQRLIEKERADSALLEAACAVELAAAKAAWMVIFTVPENREVITVTDDDGGSSSQQRWTLAGHAALVAAGLSEYEPYSRAGKVRR